MFLFSGVLAPLVHPRPVPARGDGRSTALPAAIAEILFGTARAPAPAVLRGESAFIVEGDGRGLMAVETHLGCLVASGDPVGDGTARQAVVEDFVSLAHSGGRIPVVRNARREYLHLYAAHGMTARPAGREVVVHLPGVKPALVGHSRAGLLAQALEDRGAVLDSPPPAWIPEILPELQAVEAGVDEWTLRGSRVSAVWVEGRVVAFALYRAGASGGEVSLDRIRVAAGAPEGTLAFLVTRLAIRLGEEGFLRLLVRAPRAGLPVVRGLAFVLEDLPVALERRFTVRPRGWKGLWAQVAVHGLSEEPGILS